MILVIAEKPSVAQTVAAALGVKQKNDGYIEGNGYLVSWCVGHLIGLAEAAAYGEQYKKWSYDSLPILPQEWKYTVAADKGKQFKVLKELMHRADVSEVVNACDAGREGELIFRFVYEVAGCKKPMRRLWISSMEESAIKAGFASLKDGREYDDLYSSALCRAKADWIIGINATRLFSCLYNHTLNVGRVQTPTLKMLADRDAAISTFKKEKYYHVRLMFSGAEAVSERLHTPDEADTLKTACEASRAVCTSLVKEKKTTAPPKPHNEASLLSAMERAGNEETDPDAERKGLGTPATRAAVIEKLVKDGFIERKGKQLLPTKDGINLVCVLPETLTSPKLTAEWENNLTQIAKGKADPAGFMQGIEEMARELVKTYPFLSDDKAQLFKPERVGLGKCPRCGSPVYEGKKNYYCSNKECGFAMWKNDRFFEERKVTFSPKIAAALLADGKANVKKLYSPKTGKTYAGSVVLADTGGKYVNYRVELSKK